MIVSRWQILIFELLELDAGACSEFEIAANISDVLHATLRIPATLIEGPGHDVQGLGETIGHGPNRTDKRRDVHG